MTHDLVTIAEDFYLDYVNNYLTIDAIADHYHITAILASHIIEFGRFVNHNRSEA
jgi:hypothetical protein